MRFLLPALAAAQALGILFADHSEPSPLACWVVAAGLGLASLVARRPPVRVGLLMGAVFATGAASLAGPLSAARWSEAMAREAVVEATAARVSRHGDRIGVDWVGARSIGPGRVPAGLRTWRALDPRVPAELQRPVPGERWRQRLRLRPPEGMRNPGSRDRSRTWARRGVGAVGTRVHAGLAVRVGRDGEGAGRAFRLERRRRAERLAAAGPGGALLAALGLGERGSLSPGARADFARLGLSHLLAVSGLHLALVAGASFAAARAMLARVPGFAARHDARRAAVAVALVSAAGYAAASGFAIPVQRALMLLGAAALALVLRRPRRRAAPLALAAFALLAGAPHALFEAGFQLSFAATAALLFSRAGRVRDAGGAAGRLGQGLDGLLRTSASALLATAPIAAAHFGAGPPVGLVSNLVAIPATATVLLPAAAVAAGAAGFDGGGAEALIRVASAPAAVTLAAAAAAAEAVPAAWASPPRIGDAGVLVVAVLIAVLGVRCGTTPVRLATLLVQAAWLAWAPFPGVSPPPPRVVALDVGQGDALLVQGREGVVVVDAGRRLPSGWDVGERVVAPALAALGVARIDRLAVTHADLDHRGGVPALLERFEVGALWLPHGAGRDPDFEAIHAAAALAGVAALERGRGAAPERIGDLVVEFLWPGLEGPAARRNDRSLVLRIRSDRGGTVLLPGDVEAGAEQALLATGADVSADVLLLPHHGSRTSGSAAFLTAVAPRIALVSAPCRGRFPLPDPGVLARLAGLGASVRWTGRDGAVIVGLSPQLSSIHLGVSRPACFGVAKAGRSSPGFHEFPRETR